MVESVYLLMGEARDGPSGSGPRCSCSHCLHAGTMRDTTSINIDMTDHQLQWGCPYCSRAFTSKDQLKEHFEPDKKIIIHLLSQLQQALRSKCHQFREVNNGPIDSDGENDGENEVDVGSTKRSSAKKPLRCPNSDCRQTKQTYSKKSHLLRHFKMHVVCNAACGCGQIFDRVDRFEKHLQHCSIMQDKARDTPGLEQKHLRILGLKNVLISNAKENLNQQLEGNQKRGLSDDAMESSSSCETFGTKLPDSKRKRTTEREVMLTVTKTRPSTKGTERRRSDSEESMIGVSSPKAPLNSAVQCGPLDDAGHISSYIGAIIGVQSDTNIAINNLRSTQAFGSSTRCPRPNQSAYTLTQNSHGINPPTPGSRVIGIIDRENWSQYRTGLEWSDFNACGRGTSQDQWDILTSMQDPQQYRWDGANTHGDMEKWSCESNDWSSFHAPFDGFNNALASNI